MTLIPEDKKASYRAQLSSLARVMSKSVIEDLEDIIDAGKAERALELMTELADLKVEALVADDKRLYSEMIEDKLGSLEHVLDSERIVAQKQFAAMVARAAQSALTAFGSIGKELVKVGLKSVAGGVAGGLLGGLGEKIVDTAIDAATDSLSPE